MNHYSIPDTIIAVALLAAVLGFFYLRHREKLRRLEIIHQERLAAMDKGIPLPELPFEPSLKTPRPPDPKVTAMVTAILGTMLTCLGGGLMIALSLMPGYTRMYWPLPLPFALVGLGLLIYAFLTRNHDN